jgi:hypothetical protein
MMGTVHAHIIYKYSRARPSEFRSGHRCRHWTATNYRLGNWRCGWWYDGLTGVSGLMFGNEEVQLQIAQ